MSQSKKSEKHFLSALHHFRHNLGTKQSGMSDLTSMSSLVIADLKSNLQLATRIASLPREVRDMVYQYMFTDIDYTVGFGVRYYISSPGNRRMDALLVLIHEEALRSRIARELCQTFWLMKFSQHTLDINWEQIPDLLNPGLLTTIETSHHGSETTPYGAQPTVRIPLITTIRPRDFITGIEININDNKELRLNRSKPRDLRNLSARMLALLELPRLRRGEINLWVPRDCDCYRAAMPVIESISNTCAILRDRHGNNLSVWIMRDWPHHRSTFKFIDHDISWMWEPPGCAVRMISGTRRPTAAEDRIRTLIMDIRVPRKCSEKSLLKELQEAASSLPQRREDIAAEEGGWKGEE